MSTTNRWGGSAAVKERNIWRPQVEAGGVVCCRCNKPIAQGQSWQVDHYPISREDGGTQTWPAHSHCNMSAGGKRGAAIVKAKRMTAKYVGSSRVGSSVNSAGTHVGNSTVTSANDRGIRGL